MQFNGLKANGRNLARGCAVLMIAGAAAGCSSQAMRFNGVDDVFTSSTNNQRAIINKQNVDQPYPGDTVAPAPVDGSHTQSVSRSSLEPVTSQQLPPPSAPAAAKPIRTASAPALAPAPAAPHLDRTATNTVAPAKPFKTAEPDAVRNASATPHATEIVVREGETISGLARQYHVPADAIIKVNGLDANKGIRTGQKIVIPAYAYSSKGGPKVADSTKPANPPKQPAGAPEKVAVLPQQPKLKDGKSAAQVDASAAASGSKSATPAQMAEAKPAGAGGTYTVQQGDSLSSIARKTGVGVTALKQANGMKDGLLKIGQTLKVPAGGTVAVAAAKPVATKPTVDPVTTATTQPPAKTTPSETLASYTPPKKDAKVIQQAEDDDAVAPDATGIGKMRWPVRGRVISGFGSGKDGVDIAVPEGTPIKAAENGVVIYAGDGLKEFGNTVLVRHENGLVTVYGHASSIEVQRGQKVKRGQEIALSGMSGTTDSPKLHFEVRKNSAPVDPSGYLE
ncbi:LysM peptidoglycan-binding domain-containing M23 family metallopeptidase [Mesorhizobium sp. WSM3862]|uniref:LysM peptidoglycan-binding domain-containing M23 family metallopeptidase n=1 Tax=Mesorhizobium sp. WSM3862 TaxID=632858 RepID=UPI000BAF61F2|nr:LysM peptidoglycan-binding domain-containing M23 family metallopeptidase [Mesorhizobium sp. WSM3862]PBC00161.1 peptigoglycan-binding protein LysM [Mesorhizobium sp. WSM3862]